MKKNKKNVYMATNEQIQKKRPANHFICFFILNILAFSYYSLYTLFCLRCQYIGQKLVEFW